MVAVMSYNASWLTSGSREGEGAFPEAEGSSGLLSPIGGRWHFHPPAQLLLQPLALLFRKMSITEVTVPCSFLSAPSISFCISRH